MHDSSRVRRRLRIDGLKDGVEFVTVDGASLKHLLVLRAEPGDQVFLFDGCGREVEAEILEINPSAARLEVLRTVAGTTESPLDCWLIQALPVRLPRMDTIVRQVTELGVTHIVPVSAERSQVRAGDSGLAKKTERWRRIADAAAEQSRRQRVPAIDEPCKVTSLPWAELPELVLLLDPGAEGVAWDRALSSPAGSVAVMVGPEGGWSSAEVTAAVDHGAVPVGMGPRILRADTAGVVAVALLQRILGDLR